VLNVTKSKVTKSRLSESVRDFDKVKVQELFGSLMELYYLCTAKVIQV
jgi:hypothetical protein